MVFKERDKWNTVATVSGVTNEMRINTDQGRCPICFGEDDVTHTLQDCLEN